LLATFHYGKRAVCLLTVHIDKDTEQGTHDLQLRTVFDLFVALRDPAILLGDLNEVDPHPELVRLLSTPGVHNALAQVSRTGIRKAPVDWILTKGFRTVRGEWKENSASDHPVARVTMLQRIEAGQMLAD
jgi:endonuclease/exonuclease/phosphatase (EEP) superfamily protein YafD